MDDPKSPHLTDKALAEAETRKRRQAEALRANLQKRKAQGRARAETSLPPALDSDEPVG